MKRKTFLSVIISLLITVCCIFAVGCNGDGTVPVYEGMTVSSSPMTGASLTSYRSKPIMKAPSNGSENGNTDNNGNHNGWYKGDYADRDDTPDQDNPYPDNASDENIENEIEDTLRVEGAGKDLYCAPINQDVYIYVHINNPDGYEILSFTLNGEKYSSYMFEKGSDMETLILKVNVGAVSGVKLYTIDKIKYVNGEDIKDVVIGGDQTVQVGVSRDNQVTANVSEKNIRFNDISFNVQISDNDGLIAFSKGKINAVIYDGTNILSTQELQVGENTVTFSGLQTNEVYQYAIVAAYNNLKNGFDNYILYEEAFYTKPIVLFDNITIGQESASFQFVWTEAFAGNKQLTSLSLYHEGAVSQTLNVSDSEVNGLLSGKLYTLIAEYDNNGATENIYLDFTTKTKERPMLSVVNATKTQTSVSFVINEKDADNVGEITKIELIHEKDGTIVAENIDVRSFENLSSLLMYDCTLKITYQYDLNDGNGVQEIVAEHVYKVGSVGLKYTKKSDNTYMVSGIGTCKDTQISIPRTYEGLLVTSIGDSAFENCTNLTSVVILDSVTSIGSSAFEGCTKLTNVVILDSVTSIGRRAFYNTGYYYDTYNWEDNVLYIGKHLIYASNYNFDKRDEGTVYVSGEYKIKDGTVSICDDAFYYCDKLTSIVIPDSVTSIGEQAFERCTNLTSVVIPDSVTSIGENAFQHCNRLTSVVIPDSVTSIGRGTFESCTNLTSVVIPDSVTSIGNHAFHLCTNLTSVVIPDSVTSIGFSAFYNCTNLTSVVIGDSVTSIASSAFSWCTNLTNITVDENNKYYSSLDSNLYNKDKTTLIQYAIGKTDTSFTIPDSVTSIGEKAFYYCKNLTSVVIGDSVTSIGDSAFYYCTNLTSVVIGDSVTSIGGWAFSHCDNLTSIVIPDSVTSIGVVAFSGCTSLTSIVIPDSVTSMSASVFLSCENLKIYCEAERKPSEWDSKWNYKDAYTAWSVVWGYKGE